MQMEAGFGLLSFKLISLFMELSLVDTLKFKNPLPLVEDAASLTAVYNYYMSWDVGDRYGSTGIQGSLN